MIVEKRELIDFFGIVLHGMLRVGEDQREVFRRDEELTEKDKNNQIYLEVGDMIGQNNLSEQVGTQFEEKWDFDIFAETEGLMAILPFGEIKGEFRKNQHAMIKIFELAAR